MKICHVIPPVEDTARDSLKNESIVALRSIGKATDGFSNSDVVVSQVPEGWVRYLHGLPVFGDVLGVAAKGADYLIYTNADICVQPYFYEWMDQQLRMHPGAHIINRRTLPVPARPIDTVPLSDYYAMVGMPHPGLDCFVFPMEWLPEIKLHDIVIGRPPVGTTLATCLVNIAAEKKKLFMIHENLHLTFHIGDEQPWATLPDTDKAKVHNSNAHIRTLADLTRKYSPVKTLDAYWDRKMRR